MNYKSQLYFVISFIILRILMFIFFMFFVTQTQSGSYTTYLLILHCVFDVLILAYLYHFVKVIKRQPFSLIAVILVIASIIITLLIQLLFPFETIEWSQFQMQMLFFAPNIIRLGAKAVLIVQLIRNKSVDLTGKYLKILGWTYVFVIIGGFGLGSLCDFFPFIPVYSIQLITALPWIAMIVVYVKELQKNSDTIDYIGGTTVDSEV